MHNPWRHEEVPDDAAVKRSKSWVKIAGALMWVVVGSISGVLMFTDAGGEQAAEITLQALQLTAIITAICISGWIVQKFLRRLSLLNGALVNLFTALFTFGLPILVGIVAHQMGFLSGPLSNEVAKAVPVDQWQRQVGERAVGPIKDVFPWS